MKKFLTKFVTLALATIFLVVAGCGSNGSWKESDVTLKNPGALVSANGFIAETENYVYFINGIGDSTANNKFGAPIKGALMAASKADIVAGKAAEEIEKCIVVPKLFVAKDYNAGLFISGGYVYYGTPVTDKDSSGSAASDQLQFMRTKLDGTDSTTYFKTESISDQYRMIEANGVVYIVVYDSTNSQIISYNTSSKEQKIVAKIDEKTENDETLKDFVFVDANSVNNGAILYTTTVYTEKYQADAAENSNYTRPTAKYNNVYMYKAGDAEAKLVLSGKTDKITYAINFIQNGYVYYTATKAVTVNAANTYAITVSDLYVGNEATVLDKADYAIKDNIIVSLDEVYMLDSAKTSIRKTTLVGDINLVEKTVAEVSGVNKLLFKHGDFVYFINEDNFVVRVKVDNVDASKKEDLNMQIVSEGTVPSEWFAPEIVGDYLFYSDNSEAGCSYVKFVSITKEVKVETEDDVDTYSLDNHVVLCQMNSDDKAIYTQAKINAISNGFENGALVFDGEDENGKTVSAIVEANKLFNALTDEQKEKVGEEATQLLEKYNYAVKLANAFAGLEDFDKLSDTEKDALETAYKTAKALVEEILETDYDIKTVRGYVENNLNYFYQEADKYFTAKK